MNDSPIPLAVTAEKPRLPTPARLRWQPLRMGLVELFHYDSEEFWFRDGHLLLRGNNGTGKSKVLSLTLPFLLDAQLKSLRLEPDGDGAKKMAWNLLMNSYDRRIGYAWIEFGRLAEDGTPRYLSLGAGLSATAARPQVESWFFILDDAPDSPRINQDLWLTNPQRVVLTKERLREQLEGRGQMFDTAGHYRRAVDERLFRLGLRRYEALMDTLIQLRQPQLSKKPDETALSNALTEALPPLAQELLGDVAEALGQLAEDRRQLEEYQALSRAVERFERRYRVYAGTQTRRQARALRQAQTEFDGASRARAEAQSRLEAALAEEERARLRHGAAEICLSRARAQYETLRDDPTMQDANRLAGAERDAEARRQALWNAQRSVEEASRRLKRSQVETAQARQRAAHAEHALSDRRRQIAGHAEAAGIDAGHAESPLAALGSDALADLGPRAFEDGCAELHALAARRRDQIALMRRRQAELVEADAAHRQRLRDQDERRLAAETAAERRTEADAEVERQGQRQVDAWGRHFADLEQLQVDPGDRLAALAALAEWVVAVDGENPARALLQAAQQRASLRLAERGVGLDGRRQALQAERQALQEERDRLQAGVDSVPPQPHTRDPSARDARSGAPLWRLVDFSDGATAGQRAGLEAALEASGLLDAWVSPDGRLQTGEGGTLLHDTHLVERPPVSGSLAQWLRPDVPGGATVPAATVEQVLSSIACGDDEALECEAWVALDGRFRLGALAGAWSKPEAVYIGHAARAAARSRRLAEIARRLAQLAVELAAVDVMARQLAQDRQRADEEWRLAPTDDPLRVAHLAAAARAREAQVARERLVETDERCRETEQALRDSRARLATDAADLHLPDSPTERLSVEVALDRYRDGLAVLIQAGLELRLAFPELQRQAVREAEARDDLEKSEAQLAAARIESAEADARLDALRDAVGAMVVQLQQQLAAAQATVTAGEAESKGANKRCAKPARPARSRARRRRPRRSSCSSAARSARKRSRGCSSSRQPACCRLRCHAPSCRT